MGFRIIRLSNPSQLPLAVKMVGTALEQATINSLRKTARFGHTAVIRTAAKTKPKPEASQTYRQAWTVQKTKTGAILGNSARSSYFVEVGRRAGRMPPYSNPAEGILLWVQLKRFKFGSDGKIQKRKPRKSGGGKKKTPAEQKGKAQGAAGGKPKKPSKASLGKRKAQQRFAFLVARKIAKKGTPGRYVLARTMPKIQKRAIKETKRALRKVTQKKGRP